MARKQRPWLPESSGENVLSRSVDYAFGDWEAESRTREENEQVVRPCDGYYRDTDGYLSKATIMPHVNGPRWEKVLEKYSRGKSR